MKKLVWVMLLLLVVGCAAPSVPTPTPQPMVLPSAQPVPATFTPGPAPAFPTASPLPTREATPTAAAETPIPFENTVVELRYRIPALGLDRRLQGNIGSQIILIDETTGKGQQRDNQATILLQLQQVLQDVVLSPVPDECDQCVLLSYDLPLEEKSGSGWLQDVTLLASIENFMAIALGAHFPPGTISGLRRSASPYAPAQTLAVMEDGRLWVWQATQDTIPDPLLFDPNLQTTILAVDAAALKPEYVANCQGVPLESLYFDAEEPVSVTIACPEYALPTSLLSLYAQYDVLLNAQLGSEIERPPVGFPLDALLDLQREDGARLTLYADGTAVSIDKQNDVFTNTLAVSQVISLTTTLIDSGDVRLGLRTFDDVDEEETAVSRILVRGEGGVYDGMWQRISQVPSLVNINALLDSFILPNDDLPEATETPVAPSPTP
jgi:hypothetical protein